MSDQESTDGGSAVPAASRRAVLAGVAGVGVAAALGGCSTYGKDTATPPADPPAGGPSQPATGGGEAIAQLADIPTGGGKIFADKKVVITQPTAGNVQAFSTVCTHQGCDVAEITGGTINCPCHGSKFKIEDGSVTAGPATSPLEKKAVTVANGAITLA